MTPAEIASLASPSLSCPKAKAQTGMVLVHGAEELDPVHSGHPVVGDNTVEVVLDDQFESPVAARRPDDKPVAPLFQHLGRRLKRVRVVVDVESSNVPHLIHGNRYRDPVAKSCSIPPVRRAG